MRRYTLRLRQLQGQARYELNGRSHEFGGKRRESLR